MTDVAKEIDALGRYARRLDELSKAQASTLETLEPIEHRYVSELSAFEGALWKAHLVDGSHFPSERVRIALYQAELPKDLFAAYVTLRALNRRLEKEISHLKSQIDARRSILSALKLEMEATT